MTAQVTARYSDLSRLPGPTGDTVQRQMATLKARLVARYGLRSTPGRPEELTRWLLGAEQAQTVSVGYGCGTIRIRQHDGRRWADWIDIQVNDGWHAEVYAYLDPFFNWTPHQQIAKAILTNPIN